MSKLFFRYGAMNSGKSTALLQVAHNYEERGQRVLLIKPAIDTKGDHHVVSRLGVSRRADIVLGAEDSLKIALGQQLSAQDTTVKAIDCLLIDEAQFLTPLQVDEALEIAVRSGIPVIAYGIRTDFRTRSFPGSQRLMEIAHKLEELKTICRCGSKAIFNARLTGAGIALDGEQIMIDQQEARYEALCARCYLDQRAALDHGQLDILDEDCQP